MQVGMGIYFFGIFVLVTSIIPVKMAVGSGIQKTYRGLDLVTVSRSPEKKLDISVVGGLEAINRVKMAIDILLDKSPFSARSIGVLRSAGQVVLIYDPHFPKSQFTDLTIAAFFPNYYQAYGRSKRFVTVIGRYGIKWPSAELAAVLAHELVGHGMQHLRGRLEHVRTIDLECEAYLYEEMVYQDLGLDKRLPAMIKFRQALEDHWCKTFRADAARHDQASVALWERLNPDVPGILEHYLTYIERMRKDGSARKAIDIERRSRLRN